MGWKDHFLRTCFLTITADLNLENKIQVSILTRIKSFTNPIRQPPRQSCFIRVWVGKVSWGARFVEFEFSNANVDFILALSLPAISKIIGEEWKKLSEEQSQVSENCFKFSILVWFKDLER